MNSMMKVKKISSNWKNLMMRKTTKKTIII